MSGLRSRLPLALCAAALALVGCRMVVIEPGARAAPRDAPDNGWGAVVFALPTPTLQGTATPMHGQPAWRLQVLPTATATPTPTPTITPTPTATPTPYRHVVQPGETLADIAARYGVTEVAILAANGLGHPRSIRVGEALAIPAPQWLREAPESAGPPDTAELKAESEAELPATQAPETPNGALPTYTPYPTFTPLPQGRRAPGRGAAHV